MKPALLFLFILLFSVAHAAEKPRGILVEVPEGWVVTPNKILEEKLAKLNQTVLYVAQSPADDATLVFIVGAWTEDYDQSTFDRSVIVDFLAGFRQSVEGANGKVISEEPLNVSGIPAMHVETLLRTSGGEAKQSGLTIFTTRHFYRLSIYADDWLPSDHPYFVEAKNAIKIVDPQVIPSSIDLAKIDSTSIAYADGYVVGKLLAAVLIYGAFPAVIILTLLKKRKSKKNRPEQG